MLKTRIITALILLAFLVPALRAGGAVWGTFSALFVMAAQWEWNRLILAQDSVKDGKPHSSRNPLPSHLIWGMVFVLASAFWWFRGQQWPPNAMAWGLLFASLVWLVLCLRRLGQDIKTPSPSPSAWESAVFLISAWLGLMLLYRSGILVLFSAMGLIWVADIGAYFAGKRWGKRKLAPTVSPGKSWEGAIGGALAVLVLSVIWVSFFSPRETISGIIHARLGWFGMFACALVISSLSVLGDLAESQLKRAAGFKDSSNLLPGHGGVLDRIDALIPSMPVAAALVILCT